MRIGHRRLVRDHGLARFRDPRLGRHFNLERARELGAPEDLFLSPPHGLDVRAILPTRGQPPPMTQMSADSCRPHRKIRVVDACLHSRPYHVSDDLDLILKARPPRGVDHRYWGTCRNDSWHGLAFSDHSELDRSQTSLHSTASGSILRIPIGPPTTAQTWLPCSAPHSRSRAIIIWQSFRYSNEKDKNLQEVVRTDLI